MAARNFAAKVAAFELIDAAAAELAGRWRLEIDAQQRRVVDWFAPAKQAAFKAHAAICRQENEALAPYREARRIINAKLTAWRAARMDPAQTAESGAEGGAHAGNQAGASETAPRVDGVSFRENWRVEVIDKAAFVRAVAAQPELVNLVDPNLAALSHLARAHKNALDLPGVRVWCELAVAARRGPED